MVESRKFAYFPADSTGKINLRSVTLRRAEGTTTPSESDFVDVRRVELVYYDTTMQGIGSVGDLKLTKQQTPVLNGTTTCLLYTSPSPRDQRGSRMPSSA